jgi:hypothetical protein
VSAELQRSFEERVKVLLGSYEKRMDWLSRGSRQLFGTVIEMNMCILIDTSESMNISLNFVKKKLKMLIEEQLRTKQRFNLVSFNSKITPWRERSVEVDQHNIQSAFDWIDALTAEGTTNTLGAIKFALTDAKNEAIYLLTDGRPDQVS